MERPNDIREQIKTYKQQYEFVLDDYTNAYVNHMVIPSNNEYESIFSNVQGTLNGIEANLFTTTNNIQKNIEQMSGELKGINRDIQGEKSLNIRLKNMKNIVGSEENSSNIMMVDSNKLYQTQRLSNLMMLIGIFLLLGLSINT
jgi:hypothetical protein